MILDHYESIFSTMIHEPTNNLKVSVSQHADKNQLVIGLLDYELTHPYSGLYSLSAKQCQHHCAQDSQCSASSFIEDYHKTNEEIQNAFNCFKYGGKFRAVPNPKWSSYVEIEGYKFLTPSDTQQPRLFSIERLTEVLNMKVCADSCRSEQKCYAFSYDNQVSGCELFTKLGQFSSKTSVKLDATRMYLLKTGTVNFDPLKQL